MFEAKTDTVSKKEEPVVNEYNKKKQNENHHFSAAGSMGGIDALISGECDIAVSSALILPDSMDPDLGKAPNFLSADCGHSPTAFFKGGF